jgi:hypothetical protein
LYDMPTTSEDLITALKEIYNGAESKPINADLHKWARKFLARTDESSHARHACSDRDPWAGACYAQPYRGTSNYEKLISIHGDRFAELYHANPVLKDDSKLVVAELSYPGHLTDENPGVPTPIDTHMARMPSVARHQPCYMPAAVSPSRRHTPINDGIDWHSNASRSPYAHGHACAPSYSHPYPRELDYPPLGYPAPALEDSCLPPRLSSPYYDYFSRGSRRRRRLGAL